MTLEKNGVKIILKNDIQIAAYKKSGWSEVFETKSNKNKKTEE